jgi:hypothetical protein
MIISYMYTCRLIYIYAWIVLGFPGGKAAISEEAYITRGICPEDCLPGLQWRAWRSWGYGTSSGRMICIMHPLPEPEEALSSAKIISSWLWT